VSEPPPPELAVPPLHEIEPIAVERELPPLLDKLPLPKPVFAFAVVTALAFAFGAVRAPHAIEMGIKAERGQKALAAGNTEKAVSFLRPVAKDFPSADEVVLNLIDADITEGDLKEAVEYMEKFEGKNVDKETSDRLDTLASRLDAIAKEIQDREAKDAKKPKASGEAKK